jgi:hypothetical protein
LTFLSLQGPCSKLLNSVLEKKIFCFQPRKTKEEKNRFFPSYS